MKLINTRTLQLENFLFDEVPSYAILSHRWEDGEEVSYQEFALPAAQQRKGYQKIQRCCSLAAAEGIEYAWADTCCIDKSSSAELSEAINAMFGYYRDATICYVYLADVPAAQPSLEASCWFRRGWTLQELIAPANVCFYNADWDLMGTKLSLVESVARASGVAREILRGETAYHETSVAQRMSWAARRRTSRAEDQAYSLLGIFEVNMPLLYGEGQERAFIRLQEEIIKHNDDYTIFLWRGVEDGHPGLLARDPTGFAGMGDAYSSQSDEDKAQPFFMTNRGLSVTLRMLPWSKDTYVVLLPVARTSTRTENKIFLRRLSLRDQFARVRCEGKDLASYEDVRAQWADHMAEVEPAIRDVALFVRGKITSKLDKGYFCDDHYGIPFELDDAGTAETRRANTALPGGRVVECTGWPRRERILTKASKTYRIFELGPGRCGTICLLDLGATGVMRSGIRWIQLGFDWDFNAVCFVGKASLEATRDQARWDTVRWAAEGKAVYVTSSLHNTAWSQGAHRKGGPVAVAPVPGSRGAVYALRAKRGRGFRAFVVEADDYMLRLELRFPSSHRPRINNCELFAQVVAR